MNTMLDNSSRTRTTTGSGEVTRFKTRLFYDSKVYPAMVEGDLARKHFFKNRQSNQSQQVKGRTFWAGAGSVGNKINVNNAVHVSKPKFTVLGNKNVTTSPEKLNTADISHGVDVEDQPVNSGEFQIRNTVNLGSGHEI